MCNPGHEKQSTIMALLYRLKYTVGWLRYTVCSPGHEKQSTIMSLLYRLKYTVGWLCYTVCSPGRERHRVRLRPGSPGEGWWGPGNKRKLAFLVFIPRFLQADVFVFLVECLYQFSCGKPAARCKRVVLPTLLCAVLIPGNGCIDQWHLYKRLSWQRSPLMFVLA